MGTEGEGGVEVEIEEVVEMTGVEVEEGEEEFQLVAAVVLNVAKKGTFLGNAHKEEE